MKAVNLTSHRSADLKPLIAFARARVGRLADLARLELRDAPAGVMSYGEASMNAETGASLAVPSLVEVWVSQPWASNYPLPQQYVPELPQIWLQDWSEEVLLVIAHELRHIVQFWEGDNLDAYAMEVDAEAFAIETLYAWRQETAEVTPLLPVSATRRMAA